MDKLTNLLRYQTNLSNRRQSIQYQLKSLKSGAEPYLNVYNHSLPLDKDLVLDLLHNDLEATEEALAQIARKVEAINALLEA